MYETQLEEQAFAQPISTLQAECQWCGQILLLKRLQYHEIKCQKQVQCTFCKKRVQMRLINSHEKYCQLRLKSDKKVDKLQFEQQNKEQNNNLNMHKDEQQPQLFNLQEQQLQLGQLLNKLTIDPLSINKLEKPEQQHYQNKNVDKKEILARQQQKLQEQQLQQQQAKNYLQEKIGNECQPQPVNEYLDQKIDNNSCQPESEYETIQTNQTGLVTHKETVHQSQSKHTKKQLFESQQASRQLFDRNNNINPIIIMKTLSTNSKKSQQLQEKKYQQESQKLSPSNSNHHPVPNNVPNQHQQYRVQSGQVFFNNNSQNCQISHNIDYFLTPNINSEQKSLSQLLMAPRLPLEYQYQCQCQVFFPKDDEELP